MSDGDRHVCPFCGRYAGDTCDANDEHVAGHFLPGDQGRIERDLNDFLARYPAGQDDW